MVKSVTSLAVAAPLLVGCACALLTACGGGGGSSAPAPAPPPPPVVSTIPEGFWSGSVTPDGGEPSSAIALVLATGEIRISEGNNFQLSATLSGGNATGVGYAPPDGEFSNHAQTTPCTIAVNGATPKTQFNGTGSMDGHAFTYTFNQYLAVYDQPLAPAALAGSYTSAAASNTLATSLSLTINADGTLSGSSAAGTTTLTGTYTIPDPTKAAIQLAFTVTAAGAAPSSWTGSGVYIPAGAGTAASVSFSAASSAGSFVGIFRQP